MAQASVCCSNLRVVTEVARSLTFAPEIQRLADRVIAGMTAGGQAEYNAVHLRIEKDARDWSTIMGGEAVTPGAFPVSSAGPSALGALLSVKNGVLHCSRRCGDRHGWRGGAKLAVTVCTLITGPWCLKDHMEGCWGLFTILCNRHPTACTSELGNLTLSRRAFKVRPSVARIDHINQGPSLKGGGYHRALIAQHAACSSSSWHCSLEWRKGVGLSSTPVQVVWHNYIMAMQKAGFSPDLGLYAASGLLTYGASAGESSLLP